MPKYRKMLTDWQAPYILPILQLLQTQSKETIHQFCIHYATAHLLPLCEAGANASIQQALLATTDHKQHVKTCRQTAKEYEDNPIAHTAAKAIGQCIATAYDSTASSGLIFYGALAIAYHKTGTTAPWEDILHTAEGECNNIYAALQAVAIPDEPNPAKIKWQC